MGRNVDHSLLDQAKLNKKDEFYTQLCDIECELEHYKHHFDGKTVYCNCDDPRFSNFYRYFTTRFQELGLKKVICSCYIGPDSEDGPSHGYCYEYTGKEKPVPDLSDVRYFEGTGDFRSEECIALLKEADIVVTNPPFSLFREYIRQLIEFDKQFLVIGNVNCLTYKEIFSLFKEDLVWLGVGFGRGISGFIVPSDYELYGTETRINDDGEGIISPNNCLWLTNMDISKKHVEIKLSKTYSGNEEKYPFYDNYDAINVDAYRDIPKDFYGVMGVPVTFLHKFNPDQFELIKFRKGNDEKDLRINGKTPYFRVLIRRKSGSDPCMSRCVRSCPDQGGYQTAFLSE